MASTCMHYFICKKYPQGPDRNSFRKAFIRQKNYNLSPFSLLIFQRFNHLVFVQKSIYMYRRTSLFFTSQLLLYYQQIELFI